MAKKINLYIDQGSDFTYSFNPLGNTNISTYTANSQMRPTYNSTNYVNFVCNTYSNGTVSLSLPSISSNRIEAGRYVYDCELTYPNGTVKRILEGFVEISPSVTR